MVQTVAYLYTQQQYVWCVIRASGKTLKTLNHLVHYNHTIQEHIVGIVGAVINPVVSNLHLHYAYHITPVHVFVQAGNISIYICNIYISMYSDLNDFKVY